MDALYEQALMAKRTGLLYGAFPYPTKISPEAIALFIASHTKPGDTVFDGFAGSGTTGLAALLCENPTTELQNEAKQRGLSIDWGPRNAILYELGALGAFVAKTLTNPPDPKKFKKAAESLLREVKEQDGWMYSAADLRGDSGVIRHAVWSDALCCPGCSHKVAFWDACVSLEPARINSMFVCPFCTYKAKFDEVERLTEAVFDDLTDISSLRRVRQMARVYGATGKERWSRHPIKSDITLLDRIAQEKIPSCVPNVVIPWGDLHRRGYHYGITHLHHFYTRRNLIVFARFWERTGAYNKKLRDALRFWLLSYNASHATIMSRVVAKSGQKDLVVTGAQPGVLYISGLPVEKNLFAGLQRKLKTIFGAFEIISKSTGNVKVHQKSSCKIKLPSRSIDYVFTDPPFGGNIPYAEINFLNEAWLDRYTNRSDEVIVSDSQGKLIKDYQRLLTTALTEVYRVLKPSGKATLVFHSTSSKIWHALQSACTDAQFNVECAGVLDKLQGSFKQVTTAGAVRGDPILLLNKNLITETDMSDCVWAVAEQLNQAALLLDPSEQTAQRLYSRLVNHFLATHQKIPLDADEFYRWYAAQ